MASYEPRAGDWYRNNQQQEFEVVACDLDEGSVAIQYFDGDLEEIEIDAWNELEIQPIDPPEDWSGPFDGISLEEMGDIDTTVFAGSLDNVLDDIDRND
jgi:hypothetical protein